MGRIISFSSGKGGAGETLCSVNFSAELASRGYKVLVFDIDINCSNVFILLHVKPQSKLQEYFDTNIPNKLKSHIVQKRLPVPTRYSDSGTLTDDTGWEWKNLGYMWLPYEEEVTGKGVWSTKEFQGGLRWYPCFQDGSQIVKKLGETGSRCHWWTASASSGNSANFVHVNGNGSISYDIASGTWLAVPLCMRFK